jgi:hypothetical protein
MTWGECLYFPSEGSDATDLFALKNSSLSAGFEPIILGPSGKHDNHYTIENDQISVAQ